MLPTLAMLRRMEGKHIHSLFRGGTLTCLTSTKGGAGGATTTVSTLPQLSAAASASGAAVIVVQGAISGAAKVQVTSDKTIVGKAGSCMSIFIRPQPRAPCLEDTLTSTSPYRHWPHNQWTNKRNR